MGSSRNIVILGVGALGLGFLGPEFSPEAHVWFLDVSAKADLLARLKAEKSYCVNLAGVGVQQMRVENVSAVDPASQDACVDCLADSDLVITAVGAANLPRVAPLLARAASGRSIGSLLPVLCAENERDAAKALRRYMRADAPVVIADTVVGRMCRWLDEPETSCLPLFGSTGAGVVAEAFYGIPYDVVPGMPPLPFSCLQPRVRRKFDLEKDIKLFAHNCVHGLWAYASALRGSDRIVQAALEPSILDRTDRMLHNELMPALRHHYGDLLDINDFLNYSMHLIRRLQSPAISDTVERGVRGASDKLLPTERWISAVRFIRAAGIRADAYVETIAEVILVSGLLRHSPLRTVLAIHCGFTPEEIEHIGSVIEQTIKREGTT